MASNNSRPNRFVPEGGGGWRKAPQQQQSRRSAKPSPKNGNNKGESLRYLKELFGQVLDEEIIESVAESCGWHADTAIESLIELSNDVCVPATNHSPNFPGSNQARVADQSRKTAVPTYKAPKPATQTATSSPAMAAIKVAYQGYDEDSDDADVIMEDEEEFEVVSNANQSLPSLPDSRSASLQGSVTSVPQLRDAKRGLRECPQLSTIRDYIAAGHRILVLMRGCPGSGKSHLARALIAMYVDPDCDPAPYIFSTDAYFSRSGRYAFNPADLPSAHEWNQKGVEAGMQRGLSPLVVDNTNTMVWEMKCYAKLAVRYGYAVELLEPTTPWCWNESELARRNSHGVARVSIRNMLDRYEKVTTNQLMSRLKLMYSDGNWPPQPCSNPLNNKKKARNHPPAARERGEQNVARPPVQSPPSLLTLKLDQLVVTAAEGNGGETTDVTAATLLAETTPQNLFADLKPLTPRPLFTTVETVEEQTIKQEVVAPVDAAPSVAIREPMPEVESLQSLVEAQDSIGWQLIESLDDVIIVEPELPSAPEETAEPEDLYKKMRQDVDYAPRSSNELFEEMENTNASFVDGDGLEADEDMISVEKVLGDAFDHAFKLPFGSDEIAQENTTDAPVDDRRNRDDASINTCLEYVVVGPDNSLLFQKSHDEFDKRTEDVTKQVVEQVLSESVDDIPGGDPEESKARTNSVQFPGDIVPGIDENYQDMTNPFMGLLERTETSLNKDADVCFQDDVATRVDVSLRDEELVSQKTEDKLGSSENVLQTSSSECDRLPSQGETERNKSEPNDGSPTAGAKKADSLAPEKLTAKDLFNWFFAKKKPIPDLTESHQTSKEDGLLGTASTENNSATGSNHLPNQSQATDTLPTPDSVKWKLTSSWGHSTAVEDGATREPSSTARTETSNSSTACEDVICDTSVQTANERLQDVEHDSSEKQSSQVNSDEIVPSSKPSEQSYDDALTSPNDEPEKREFRIVSPPDDVLPSMNTFDSDFSLLEAEIPNAALKSLIGPENNLTSSSDAALEAPIGSEPNLPSSSGAIIALEPPIGSEPNLPSSSDASTALEPPIGSEPNLPSSSVASIALEPPIGSEPNLPSSSVASIALEPPIGSEPNLPSSSVASIALEPPIGSEPNLPSSSVASIALEPPIGSEPNLLSSSDVKTALEPLIGSEPELTRSSDALEPPIDSEPNFTSCSSDDSTALEPPIGSEPNFTSCSSDDSTALEPPTGSEPELKSSSDANLDPVVDISVGSDDLQITSDLTESESATVEATPHPEENINSRLGSENFQYTSAWSKMSPSNMLQDDDIIPTTSRLVPDAAPSKTPTKDSETNTSYSDFSLIEHECGDDVRYLSGRSRSINVGGRSSETHRTLPTISTLDKGSMTAPEDLDSEQPDFELLANMFPKIARELLRELFDRCQGEINWTVDLLLESGHAFEPSESLEIRFHNTEDLRVTQQLLEELDVRDTRRSVELDTAGCVTRGFETDAIADDVAAASTRSPSKRAGRRQQTSEFSLRLKKEMEKNIDLNDSSYSEETLRLKKIRHGTRGPAECEAPPSAQDAESDEGEEGRDEGGSVQMTLDAAFLAQLKAMFGELSYPYPEGVPPVVDLPLDLARQIHAAITDSQQRQFDMQEKYFADMIQDEEFARRLQAQEMPPPDLRQIMDMELALELYRADARAENNEDMATRLSRRKLAELFPTVDPEMLYDVFAAHGNSFQETLEVLEASTGEPEEAVRNVLSPEALAAYERQLIERAKQESHKQRAVEREQASSAFERNASTTTSSKDQALEQAKLYREEANRQYQLRSRCYQQAHDAMRNGQPAVASYYAQVGQLYKQYIDKANARAAASLLTAHTMSKSSTTLDLHYLFVVEALQALDIFMDHHISKLVDSGKSAQQLFVITGGGNRSVGGRPKIKPAVEKRLVQRGIKFSTLNHGQLRVVVTRHMALSNGNVVN